MKESQDTIFIKQECSKCGCCEINFDTGKCVECGTCSHYNFNALPGMKVICTNCSERLF